MKEIKEIKKYPSQENTKSIACRVPISDYVKFLQEAIDYKIKMNDWLLMKIYSNSDNVGGTHFEDKENIEDGLITPEDFIRIKGNHITSESRFEIIDKIFGTKKDKEYIVRMLDVFFIDYVNVKYNSEDNIRTEADIVDVKNQLTILIENKFQNLKEKREYRKELFSLLDELEEED